MTFLAPFCNLDHYSSNSYHNHAKQFTQNQVFKISFEGVRTSVKGPCLQKNPTQIGHHKQLRQKRVHTHTHTHTVK